MRWGRWSRWRGRWQQHGIVRLGGLWLSIYGWSDCKPLHRHYFRGIDRFKFRLHLRCSGQ